MITCSIDTSVGNYELVFVTDIRMGNGTDQIKQDLDISFMAFLDQLEAIVQSSIRLMYILIVGDVITLMSTTRRIIHNDRGLKEDNNAITAICQSVFIAGT